MLVAGRARQIAAMDAAAMAVTRMRDLVFIAATSSRDAHDRSYAHGQKAVKTLAGRMA